MELLDRVFLGNTLRDYLIAAAVVAATLLTVRVARLLILWRLRKLAQKTESTIDDVLIDTLEQTRYLLVLVIGLYFGSLVLERTSRVQQITKLVVIIAALVQVGIWATAAIRSGLADYRKKKQREDDLSAVGSMAMVAFFGRVAVWALIALLIFDNLGVDITALVAGLGIGGIAIALALQSVLGDLFASVSIMLDKPFEVGDFLIVGDYLGTVEKIGIKTTRFRSLGGEELVFSNSDLLSTRIRNYKDMEERRAVFSLGVTYQTPAAELEKIPEIVREAIEAQDGTRFDRAHFKAFGDSAYLFEVVYWLLDPDYTLFMDRQQAINLSIVRTFEERGIEIAYPTRTLYLHQAA